MTTAPDWNLAMEHEAEVLEAAGKVYNAYAGAIPLEDLVQEGLLYVATHTTALRKALSTGGRSYLEWYVRQELRRLCTKEAKKACLPYDDTRLL